MDDDALQRRVDAARTDLERSLVPLPPDLSGRHGVRRRNRVLGVAAMATAAIATLVVASGPDRGSSVTAGPSPQDSRDLLGPGSARPMSPSPLSGRSTTAAVWTGSEMVVWGGESSSGPLGDGAAYSPRRDSWRLLPAAPLSPRNAPAAVWTGSEVLLWGGHGRGVDHADGAAFDPSTDTWRSIASAPIPSAGRPVATWSGTEMIVLAGFNSRAAAAYDPERDAWRMLPELPAQLQAPKPAIAWTGSLVATATLTSVIGSDPSSGGAVYTLDPSGDAWAALPPLPPGLVSLAWTGEHLLAVSGSVAAVLEAGTGEWARVAEAGPAPANGDGAAVWTGSGLLLWGGGAHASLVDPSERSWRAVPAGGLDERVQPAAVWADGVLVAWGGFPDKADGVVLRPPETSPANPAATGPDSVHECVGTKSPPPAPAATFAVVGQSGSSWQLPVGPEGVVIEVSVTQRAGTEVHEVRFEIAPDDAPDRALVVRRIAVEEALGLGTHRVRVRWDGLDDDGRRVAPGAYRLDAATRETTQRAVECADGSGRGVERFRDTATSSRLGTLIVQ